MATIEGTQNIPSELLWPYKSNLSLALPNDTVKKRVPFRWPPYQKKGYKTTAAQELVRAAFLKCVKCFAAQPESGGAEPSGYGGYSRSWWFDQSPSLWYYDYFIQQSWQDFFDNTPPKWCKTLDVEDCYVAWGVCGDADTNYDWRSVNLVRKMSNEVELTGEAWTLFKQKDNHARDWTTIRFNQYNTGAICEVRAINRNSYDSHTVTWNTRPALGALLATLNSTISGGWITINIPPLGAAALIVIHAPGGWGIPPDSGVADMYSTRIEVDDLKLRISP